MAGDHCIGARAIGTSDVVVNDSREIVGWHEGALNVHGFELLTMHNHQSFQLDGLFLTPWCHIERRTSSEKFSYSLLSNDQILRFPILIPFVSALDKCIHDLLINSDSLCANEFPGLRAEDQQFHVVVELTDFIVRLAEIDNGEFGNHTIS